jgi:hypothetical protein
VSLPPSIFVPANDPDLPRIGFGTVAKRYQRLGWAVLGLERKQKRPHRLMRHGVLWADTDPAMAEWMWGQDPGAGIGIATGAASGLLVVDQDLHGGADGTEVWRQYLAERGLSLPPGPWVQSPSGGRHDYYALPPGADMPQRPRILPSVDLKISGGYVGAPPTMINVTWSDGRKAGEVGIGYRWNGDPDSVPMAPDWLIDFALNAPSTGGGSNGSGGGDGGALDDLTEIYATGLPVGERNTRLMQLACQQFSRYGSRDRYGMAMAAIEAVLKVTTLDGFGAAERHTTIESARAFIARREREDQEAADTVPDWQHYPGVKWPSNFHR